MGPVVGVLDGLRSEGTLSGTHVYGEVLQRGTSSPAGRPTHGLAGVRIQDHERVDARLGGGTLDNVSDP